MSMADGGWQTGMYSIDEGPGKSARQWHGYFAGFHRKVSLISANGGVYEGKS